ncbi:unnamed protein product [Malus baccata var. baccata]
MTRGTAAVQCISFNISEIGPLNHADFRKMFNLRLLNVDSYGKLNVSDGNSELNVSLPNSLRYLCWVGYQLKSLPSEFSPDNLVELRMPYSSVEQLWNKGQKLGNLKVMDLSHSMHLTEVPDLSQCPKIKHINLMKCLRSLEELNLSYCELDLSGTMIPSIPASIKQSSQLSVLRLTKCKKLLSIPELPVGLQILEAQGCLALETASKSRSALIQLCHDKMGVRLADIHLSQTLRKAGALCTSVKTSDKF